MHCLIFGMMQDSIDTGIVVLVSQNVLRTHTRLQKVTNKEVAKYQVHVALLDILLLHILVVVCNSI